MQSDRNLSLRDNPQGRAKNGANLLLAVPPPLERIVKKPLAALLVAAATFAALAAPVGAASASAEQTTSLVVPCSDPVQYPTPATVTYRSTSGGLTWIKVVDDSCPGDWIEVDVSQGQTFVGIVNFAPGTFQWTGRQLVAHHLQGDRVTAQIAQASEGSGVPWCDPAPYPRYAVQQNKIFDCNQKVPTKSQIVKKTEIFPCANGKKATFHHEGWQQGPDWWITTNETVDNPCSSQWLVIWTNSEADSQTNCCSTVSYGPGTHFHAQSQAGVNSHVNNGQVAQLQTTFDCQPDVNDYWIYQAGHTSGAPGCPPSP